MSKSLVPNSTSQQELTRIFRMIEQELMGLRKAVASSGSTSQAASTSSSSGGQQQTIQNISYIGPKGRRHVLASTPILTYYETAYVECEFTESCDMISVKSSHPAWIRVYSSAAARLEDSTRPYVVDPVPGHGIMGEVATYEPDFLEIGFSPVPFFNNNDATIGKTAYIAVTSMASGYAGVIDLDFSILPQEQTGASGMQGKTGLNGRDGVNGVDGRTILSGTTDPGPADGADGDYFLKNGNTLFGPKAAGVWPAGISLIGPPGTNGLNGSPGADGNTLLYGAADPGPTDGVNGNYWINNSTHTLFGPKAAGSWPTGVSLVGPAGAAGMSYGMPMTFSTTTANGAGMTDGGVRFNNSVYSSVTTVWIQDSNNTGTTLGPYLNTIGVGDTIEFKYNDSVYARFVVTSNTDSGAYHTFGVTYDIAEGAFSNGNVLRMSHDHRGPAGANGTNGVGVPAGGTTHQVLRKINATDYNTEWADPASGLPLGGTTGQALVKLSNADLDAGWGTVSGGGAGDSFSYFDPDKPPTSPSTLNDEFSGTSLDAKWTTVYWNLLTRVSESGSLLQLVSPAVANSIPTLLQSLPAGDFTVVLKNVSAYGDSASIFGLVLSNSATAGSGNQHIFFYQSNVMNIYTWTGFNTVGSAGSTVSCPNAKYIRLSRSGTTYTWSASSDGIFWTTPITSNPAFTPTHVGFMSRSYTVAAVYTYEYFRYYNTATPTLGGMRNIGLGTDTYSTTETLTNKVWIDGKPIYRKVISCGALPNSTTKTVAHGITGATAWVSITGTAYDGAGNALPLNVGATSTTSDCGLYLDASNVYLVTGLNRSGMTGYAVLEYTK